MSSARIPIEKIAHIARLSFTKEEFVDLESRLEVVFNWLDEVHEIDADDLEPLYNINASDDRTYRDSTSLDGANPRILSNTPHKREGFILVPKVIGDE